MAPKLYIYPYLVMWCDLYLWPLDLKFSEIFNTTIISVFVNEKKFLSGTLKLSYGTKNTLLIHVFGPVVTLTFDLFSTKFSEMVNTAL